MVAERQRHHHEQVGPLPHRLHQLGVGQDAGGAAGDAVQREDQAQRGEQAADAAAAFPIEDQRAAREHDRRGAEVPQGSAVVVVARGIQQRLQQRRVTRHCCCPPLRPREIDTLFWVCGGAASN